MCDGGGGRKVGLQLSQCFIQQTALMIFQRSVYSCVSVQSNAEGTGETGKQEELENRHREKNVC